MGLRSTLSQRQSITGTQTTLGRDCVWDWRDNLWEQNFAALLKFQRREGHCCVPIYYRKGNLKLGWWVATQRRNRKIISPERRARLNNLGFVWKVEMGPVAYRATGSRHTPKVGVIQSGKALP